MYIQSRKKKKKKNETKKSRTEKKKRITTEKKKGLEPQPADNFEFRSLCCWRSAIGDYISLRCGEMCLIFPVHVEADRCGINRVDSETGLD